jgi:hypothetical protein
MLISQRLRIQLIVMLASSSLATAAFSDEPIPSELKLKTQRVVVFKDGYCLVIKEGIATTDEAGVVFTDEVPDAAILGSFWAVPESGTLQAVVAGWQVTESEIETQVNCTTVIEIVKANLGKQCTFEQGEEKFSGRLLKVLSNDDREELNFARAASAHEWSHGQLQLPTSTRLSVDVHSLGTLPTTTLSGVTGTHFLLQTQSGDVMIATDSIRNLTIDDMTSTQAITATRKSRHKRLAMRFADAKSDVKISLMYFRPDVRWIPTYRVNLTDKPFNKPGIEQADQNGKPTSTKTAKTAELIMQGEILNEAEDFTDVPFHVVVGVPNFRFRTTPSPMVLESTLQNALRQAAPDIMSNSAQNMNYFSNAIYTQQASEFRSEDASGDEVRTAIELPAELNAKAGNDLFVYELAPMSLKKGERAQVPILRTNVAYRDVYTWDVEVPHTETYLTTEGSSSPLALSENKVWRQIELINDTDIPWTTGAAMFVDGYQALAQELLTYTSPGGICRIPVTVSVDLRGKIDDSETKREMNAFRWRNNDYMRVTGKIEFQLTNNKKEPVTVEIRLRFGGKSTSTSPDGTITNHPFRAADWTNGQGDPINNSTLIQWVTNIEPGESFKPLVDYEFFMRH